MSFEGQFLGSFDSLIQTVGPALYGAPGINYSPYAVAAVRVPAGVFCFGSALFIHGVLGQSPDPMWMAVPRSA